MEYFVYPMLLCEQLFKTHSLKDFLHLSLQHPHCTFTETESWKTWIAILNPINTYVSSVPYI